MFPKYLLPLTLLFAALPAGAANNPEISGVPNFHQVDAHVYRGAQPTDEGYRSLSKLGIKTVVDLQESGDRGVAESKAVAAAGMQYISVPMKGMARPSDTSVEKVLGLLEDSNSGPVFVHCHRGADRTGGVIACYRIEHDHWESGKALDEARSLGMSWYQKAIQGYVRGFVPRTSIAADTSHTSGPALAPAFAR